jgi:hypothetical protein
VAGAVVMVIMSVLSSGLFGSLRALMLTVLAVNQSLDVHLT